MPEFPFLNQQDHPSWSQLTPDRIKPEISLALDRAEKNLDAIRALQANELTFQNTVCALEQASNDLDYAWGLVSHLDSVSNSSDLRKAHNEMLPKVSEFGAKIPLDSKLWAAILGYSQTEHAQSLSPIDRRLLEETLADFQESGADLPDDKKKRLEKISAELAQATQQFSERVLDATNDWHLVVKEEEKLKGLPESAKEAARIAAIEKLGENEGGNAWVFTLHAPSLVPALQYLDDEQLRKEIWLASDALGCVDPFNNQELVAQILTLRHEKARILGKEDFSEVALSRRMAKSGKTADQFVSQLHLKTLPFFQRENEELEAYKAEKTSQDPDTLEPWEVGYWSEKLKKESYDFDEEDLRPYFPIQSVLDGMFSLVAQVFGLKIVERNTIHDGKTYAHSKQGGEPVEVWHSDVRFYEIGRAHV